MKDSFAEKGFLTSWERSDKEFFSFFDLRELLTTGKNTWKQPIPLQKVPFQIHFKWLFWQGMVEKRESHRNKKPIRDVFRT